MEVELRGQKGGGGEVREPRGPFFMGGKLEQRLPELLGLLHAVLKTCL